MVLSIIPSFFKARIYNPIALLLTILVVASLSIAMPYVLIK
jgi:hypothetical protein